MTLSELYLEAARVAKMEESYPNIYPIRYERHNYKSKALIGHASWEERFEEVEFALAIVEGKPVFKGDVLYYKDGSSSGWHPCCSNQDFGTSSWNPPKPKTVMVELLVEDALAWSPMDEKIVTHIYGNLAKACRKALGELK